MAFSSVLLFYPLALLLQLLMKNLQRLKSHHGGDRGGNGADHISAHTVVKCSPSFFLEYDGAGAYDATVSRYVNHSVRGRGAWWPGLIAKTMLTALEGYMVVRL